MPKAKVLFSAPAIQRAALWPRRCCCYAGDQFEVYSAGLEPKSINPYTVRNNEKGVDMAGQYSKM